MLYIHEAAHLLIEREHVALLTVVTLHNDKYTLLAVYARL